MLYVSTFEFIIHFIFVLVVHQLLEQGHQLRLRILRRVVLAISHSIVCGHLLGICLQATRADILVDDFVFALYVLVNITCWAMENIQKLIPIQDLAVLSNSFVQRCKREAILPDEVLEYHADARFGLLARASS